MRILERRARLLVFGLVSGSLLLGPSAARGATYTYSALLDTDSNPATGGTVTVVQYGESPHGVSGIDAVVRVSYDSTSGMLGPVTAELYSSALASFVTTYSGSESYPLGVAVGYHGFDAAEFSVGRLAVGNPRGPIGVTFTASRGGNSDYTQTVAQSTGAAVETIPTVSEAGLLALVLGLGGGAVWLLVRRRERRRTRPGGLAPAVRNGVRGVGRRRDARRPDGRLGWRLAGGDRPDIRLERQ